MKKIIVALLCVVHVLCFAMQNGRENSAVNERFFLVKRLEAAQAAGSVSKAMSACVKLKKYEDEDYYPRELKTECDAIERQYYASREKK